MRSFDAIALAMKRWYIRAMYIRDNPSTPLEALMSMVGTDDRRGWA
jgi:hypothetical protein